MRLNKSRLLLGRVCQMMFSNTVIEMSSYPDLTTVGVGKPRFGKVYLQTEIFGPSHGAFQQYEMKAGCVYVKSENMHGIIPQLFDCWADPAGHLLLLKSSIPNHNWCRFYRVGIFSFFLQQSGPIAFLQRIATGVIASCLSKDRTSRRTLSS